MTDIDRFLAKTKPGPNGCLEWTAYRNPKGYGQFKADQKMWVAHRWIYTHIVGPIPDGLVIDPLCRNRACVNTDHLEPVTPRENTMRSPIAEAAVHAATTHCTSGHPYSGPNLYVDPSGNRRCRTCVARWQRDYQERRRAAQVSAA